MKPEISNNDDIIDSRDVIARINELNNIERDETDEEELNVLLKLQEQAEGSPDWEYGEILIRDTYFERYAEDLAGDLGIDFTHWPYTCIDWAEAARDLQMDYTCVDFDGVDYWIRL